MGACASVPKTMMKAEAGAAPVPEPAKEESVKVVETTGEVKEEQEKDINDDTKPQSLESLLDEGKGKKEEKAEEKKASEEDGVNPKEEEKTEAKEQDKGNEEEKKQEAPVAATTEKETVQEKNEDKEN